MFAYPYGCLTWSCILWFDWCSSFTCSSWPTLITQFFIFLCTSKCLMSFQCLLSKAACIWLFENLMKIHDAPMISTWKVIRLCILWSTALCLSPSSATFGEGSSAKVSEADIQNECWLSDCCIVGLILWFLPLELTDLMPTCGVGFLFLPKAILWIPSYDSRWHFAAFHYPGLVIHWGFKRNWSP